MKPYIVEGRPSQDLFFIADRRTLVRVDAQMTAIEAPDADPEYLRSADLVSLASNRPVQRALAAALAFAQGKAWELDTETVYFD